MQGLFVVYSPATMSVFVLAISLESVDALEKSFDARLQLLLHSHENSCTQLLCLESSIDSVFLLSARHASALSDNDSTLLSKAHLRNQVTALLNEAHQLAHVRTPLVENLVARLGCEEGDDPGGTVNLGVDRLGRDERRQEHLGFVGSEVEQLRKTSDGDACVVLGDCSDVLRGGRA